MKKKSRQKILYALAMVASTFLSEGAQAKIHPKAFKNITRYFKKGMEVYSPVLGEAVLEAGIIHDLRFYGNFESAFKDGKRVYIKDKSTDPLWTLEKNLFPSPAGHLQVETQAASNFGKLASPQSVALLLNYAKDIRVGKPITSKDETKLREALLASFTETDVPRKDQVEAIRPILKAIRESIQMESAQTSFNPKYMTEQVITAFFCEKFNDQKDIWGLIAALDADIVDRKIPLPAEKDFLTKDDIPLIAEKQEAYSIDDIYALANAEIFTSLIPYKSGAHLLSNGNTNFYDRSKEEILKGKTFADCAEMAIRHLINLLLFNPETKEFDLTAIKKYVAENSPDNPYFKNFVAFFELQKPDQANNGDIFMRSLFNAVVGDLNTPDDPLKIDYLKGNNEVNPGFLNLIKVFQKVFGLKVKEPDYKNFYQQKEWLEESLKTFFTALNPMKSYQMNLSQLIEEGNGEISGDLPIRVSDMKTNEDLFSFIFNSNFGRHSDIRDLYTLQKLGVQDYMEALKTHPTTIHQNTIEESLWLLSTNSELKDRALQQPLYALFNTPLTDNDSKINFLRNLNDKYESWKNQFTGEHVLAVRRMLQNVLNDISWDDQMNLGNVSPLIFALAQKEDLTETLYTHVRGISYRSNLDVNQIDWINHFSNLEYLDLSSTQNIKEVSLKDSKDLKIISVSDSGVKKVAFDNLTSLEDLYLNKTKTLEEIFLKELNLLTTISLNESGVKKIALDGLVRLEKLELISAYALEDLSLKDLPHLKKLEGHFSLKTATFDTLASLEELDLSGRPNLEQISLRGLTHLKKFSLQGSGVAKIYGLDSLSSLENLNLSRMQKLEEISLNNLGNLKKLDMIYSSIKKVEGLNTLSNLEELELSFTDNLEKLSFKGHCDQLKTINLSYSNVRRLSGLNFLTNVEMLDLSFTKNLTELEFTEDHKDLKIKLKGSGIMRGNIRGIEHLDEANIEW